MNLQQLRQQVFNNLWYGENSRRDNVRLHLAGMPFLLRAAVQTLVMPDQSRVWLLDVSHWNPPPVDLKRMVDLYSLDGVIIKGCDGSLVSRYFVQHRANAKAIGLPWGIYVWLYKNQNVSIDAQTSAWAKQANEDYPPLGVRIDAEWTKWNGQYSNPNAVDLRAAHDKFKAKTGKEAMTYTAPGYANEWLRGFDFTKEDLWTAQYGVNAPSMNPWTDWQWTPNLDGHQLDPNGNAELDGNYFNGSHQQYFTHYGIDPTEPEPPDTEVGMRYFDIKGTMNIRSSPAVISSPSNDIGDLLAGDKIETSETVTVTPTDKWGKLFKITRAGVSVVLPASTCYVSLNTTNTFETFPQPDSKPETVDIVLTAGSTITVKDAAGNVIWSGTA